MERLTNTSLGNGVEKEAHIGKVVREGTSLEKVQSDVKMEGQWIWAQLHVIPYRVIMPSVTTLALRTIRTILRMKLRQLTMHLFLVQYHHPLLPTVRLQLPILVTTRIPFHIRHNPLQCLTRTLMRIHPDLIVTTQICQSQSLIPQVLRVSNRAAPHLPRVPSLHP